MRLRLRRSCLRVDKPSVSQGHWRHRGMVHLISSQPLESHATPLATIFHYDIMRVMACLAVVLLHLAATIVMDDTSRGSISWHVANLLDAGTRWCVPLFVMLSGALLLDHRKDHDAHTFGVKRLRRIGPAILFWSVAYLLWRILFWKQSLSLETVLSDLILGRPFIHLYFLFLIGGLYLVTPYLWSAVAALSERQFRNAVVMVFGLAIGANAIDFLGTSIFTLFVPYLAYYLAGAYINRGAQFGTGPLVFTFASAIFATVLTTAFLVHQGGLEWRWAFYFYEDFSPTTVLATVALFMFASAWQWPPSIARAAHLLAPYTFGIYVAHPMIVECLRYAYHLWTPFLFRPVFYVPVTFALTLALTTILVMLIRHLPFLRTVV